VPAIAGAAPRSGTLGGMDAAEQPPWVRQRAYEALPRALPNARHLGWRAGPAKRGFTARPGPGRGTREGSPRAIPE